MIIYVLSSPDDNLLLLTTNGALAFKAVEDEPTIVLQTWDTENSSILSIEVHQK